MRILLNIKDRVPTTDLKESNFLLLFIEAIWLIDLEQVTINN